MNPDKICIMEKIPQLFSGHVHLVLGNVGVGMTYLCDLLTLTVSPAEVMASVSFPLSLSLGGAPKHPGAITACKPHSEVHFQAKELLEQAAALGDVIAMVNLGKFHLHGQGTPKDGAKAPAQAARIGLDLLLNLLPGR